MQKENDIDIDIEYCKMTLTFNDHDGKKHKITFTLYLIKTYNELDLE